MRYTLIYTRIVVWNHQSTMEELYMKKLMKRITLFTVIAILLSMGSLVKAEAATMRYFPEQSMSSYQTKYTRAIQVMLMGYSAATRSLIVNSGGADGNFGTGTYKAVLAFQKATGLGQDGVVGLNTWNNFDTNLVYKSTGATYFKFSGKYNDSIIMRCRISDDYWYCKANNVWYGVG